MSNFVLVADVVNGSGKSRTRQQFVESGATDRPRDFARRTAFAVRHGVPPLEGIKAIGDHAEQWDGWSDAVWKDKIGTND